MTTIRKCLVGLGNVGLEFAGTRHNIGFQVVDDFVASRRPVLSFRPMKHLHGDVCLFDDAIVVKPSTFMNMSGDCVRTVLEYYKIPMDHLLVVCDDVELPLGKLRLRGKGSHGGQNGLRSIQQRLGTVQYARLKVGIGRPEDRTAELGNYVLGRFSNQDSRCVPFVAHAGAAVCEAWISKGVEEAARMASEYKLPS
ncbi:peptidyl-tRNA hydrolase 1 [Andalucia godoyi]|uniref:Peptidyl-tRNA hydrolase n=1 Tax=Andalucia godoyi TaxID=505711 RepID=A0A8K0AHI1_ANDGO|nr:peptidyl-tRNA hydrolase 1 [Andalucia godoyi]|eukprot:ANDGO_04767.mRNA.1 mitochondrial peptidyl-tRNA hydrolase 1